MRLFTTDLIPQLIFFFLLLLFYTFIGQSVITCKRAGHQLRTRHQTDDGIRNSIANRDRGHRLFFKFLNIDLYTCFFFCLFVCV